MAFFMEWKYTGYIVLISFLLTNCIAYLDEGIRTFDYLMRLSDWVALFIYTALFLLLPFAIFFISKSNIKWRFSKALLGFAPAIILIMLML
ncbi:hypothetical protein M0G43_02020 [Subsaxibacter sp. CAU 1640]|uniref:hypothetical protein n=1 Tax=Subsaxibacter sp. CAU 1640 TaxID=2933271 RepID=UPI00200681F4|nr:hypothetical protein [Subsaxibacter sp. CAU 1640]MCK7589341.1 hypothetical protein [Subsaxibacter sp. CAU 1640]